jgi:hypothetical protein
VTTCGCREASTYPDVKLRIDAIGGHERPADARTSAQTWLSEQRPRRAGGSPR